jgi:MazG family protein
MPDAAAEFTRLIEIMRTLRAPDGCPWDREQTIDTLKRFVLEEAYELIDAIDRHDHQALREELGDYLFEAVFIAQLESEAGHFLIGDSVKAIADKLVRRHPHIFARETGEAALETANQVRARWEEIKQQERGAGAKPASVLSGIPAALPALARAHQIGARAASVGFDWERAGDVVAKIREEVDEIQEVVAGATKDPDRLEEEVGDLLFAIANLSRKLGVDSEAALRKATTKFSRRFDAMEDDVAAGGEKMRDLPLEDLEARWQRAKHTSG